MSAARFGEIVDYLAASAFLPRATMAAHVRALRKAGLVPENRMDAATADAAVWLLLTTLAGSAQRVREIARIPNSRQMIGDVVNDADAGIAVFDGVRDLINLRRSESLIRAGDFRLAHSGESITAAISAHAANGTCWTFTFGPLVETEKAGVWRLSVASPSLIDRLADQLGPLRAWIDAPAQQIHLLPATIAAQYYLGTLH